MKTHPEVVDRVAGVRDEDDIAWIDDRSREISDSFLRADERADLAPGIEALPEAALKPLCGSRAKLRQALVIWITMVLGVVGSALQAFDYMARGGQIGVADSKADHIDALLLNFLFQPVQFSEQIGG